MSRDFRSGDTLWKRLRVSTVFTDDDDWADDVSDGLPDAAIRGTVQFDARGVRGKNTEVEFIAIPYVAATGYRVDKSAATFSYDVTFIHDTSARNRPRNSAIIGTDDGVDQFEEIATRHVRAAGAEWCTHYRFECDGADSFTIRMHTFSATPAGATAYEIWYRPVVA